MLDDEWAFDQRIIGDDVHGATTLRGWQRQERLEDQMRDQRAVFAARVADDPRPIMILAILIEQFCPNCIKERCALIFNGECFSAVHQTAVPLV